MEGGKQQEGRGKQLQLEVRQVNTDAVFTEELELGDEGEQIDQQDQEETVDAVVGYMNTRARDDETTTDQQADLLRFVPTHHLKGDPALVAANRIAQISKDLQEMVEKDTKLQNATDTVIDQCAQGGQAEGGIEETDQPHPNPKVAYDHVSAVFGHLFSFAEMTKVPLSNLFFRFGCCLEYCYQMCKKFVQKYGLIVSTRVVVGFMFTIASFLVRHLWKINFFELLRSIGGWGRMAALCVTYFGVSDAKVAIYLGLALITYGIIKYIAGR